MAHALGAQRSLHAHDAGALRQSLEVEALRVALQLLDQQRRIEPALVRHGKAERTERRAPAAAANHANATGTSERLRHRGDQPSPGERPSNQRSEASHCAQSTAVASHRTYDPTVTDARPLRDLRELLEDAAPERFGGKALGLARACQAGVRVPRGFAIAAELAHRAAASPVLRRSIEEALASLPEGALAVRSSGVGEDSLTASQAGRFVSVVPVDRAGVWDAMRTVLASGEPGELAVLVHEHVAAREQGVAFSRDPRPGSTEGVVERWGPRDRAPRVERLRAGSPIHDALRLALARLSPTCGPSLDLEWAYRDELTVLQVRPMTAVGHAAAEPFEAAFAGDPHHWTLDGEHNPAPLSPAQAGLCALVSGAPGVGELRVACGFLFTRAGAAAPCPTVVSDAFAAAEGALVAVERSLPLPAVLAAYRSFVVAYCALGRALSAPRRRLVEACQALGPEIEALALSCISAVGARDLDLHEVALGHRSLAQHLAQFGALAPAWDVATPGFAEVPERIVPRTLPEGTSPRSVAALLTRAPSLAPLLEEARAAARLREDDDVLFARAQAAVRRALLVEARTRRLVPADDVFWVDPRALGSLSNEDVHRAAHAARRERRPGVVPPREVIAGRAVWAPPPPGAICGFGTGGRAIGHVMHLGDGPVPEPHVLVTQTITPALAHHLGGLAALVVEHGGPLGHAAIQARERGLPAVVGASGAMTLRTGTLVVVDADEGLVYLPGGTAGSLRGAGSRL